MFSIVLKLWARNDGIGEICEFSVIELVTLDRIRAVINLFPLNFRICMLSVSYIQGTFLALGTQREEWVCSTCWYSVEENNELRSFFVCMCKLPKGDILND